MSTVSGCRCLYLVQAASGDPYPELAASGRERILLTWKEPAPVAGALFYPGSTWNEGRNRLLSEALHRLESRPEPYEYYIFMDEDCSLSVDRDLARRLGMDPPENPFAAFEAFLEKWRPAVGYPRYDWHYTEADREVNLGYNFDAILNAFHREALETLLPYYTGFDAESWLYSQHLITHLAAIFYNPHRIQCNLVRVENRNRRSYAIRKKYWQIPTTFLLSGLEPPARLRMRVKKPNGTTPLGGEALKKNGNYDGAAVGLDRCARMGHPFFKFRRLPAPKEAIPAERPPEGPVAVCLSGKFVTPDRNSDNLRQCLLDAVGDHDLFIYTPEAPDEAIIERLSPTVLRVEPDPALADGGLVNGKNCRFKTGVQAYLQQLRGLRMVNELRLAHEKAHGVRYSRVIRCRPDLFFLHRLDGLRGLDPRYVHVPDFHGFEGINDRLAVGVPDLMDVYMRQLDSLFSQVAEWSGADPGAEPLCAEMCTAGHLRRHGVPVRPFRVRFNRVRPQGIIQDTEP